MTDVFTEKYYGMPGWGWATLGIGGVLGGTWLLYQYFVRPGDVILDQYKAILEDIYRETKQFCDENEAAGINGLTANQEAVLAAKQKSADYLRPQVEKIIYERGEQLWSWVETVIIGIIVVWGIKEVVPALIDTIKSWRAERPEASSNIASQYGHGHMLFELVANEYALAGKLNIASAFYNYNIPEIYTLYTQPSLNLQIVYFSNLLPTLMPGTVEFIVAQQMLNYMSYELSSATGIMAVMHTFWWPLLF